jgi:hypothetical protein
LEGVANDVHAKTKLVDQSIAEGVGFRDAAEASPQRDVEGEIQVAGKSRIAGLDL